MNIADAREKCKNYIARVPRDILIFGVLISASTLSFGLGYLTGLDVKNASTPAIEQSIVSVSADEGKVVASKSGTKYYPIGCTGAERISEKNKIWFVSSEAAVAAGYAPAENCKGI